jgi:integrase
MEDHIVVWKIKLTDRPNYRLEWLDPDIGRRKTESAKTADADQAEKTRNDKEHELNHGIHRQKSKMSWETFRTYYEEEKLAGNREGTRRNAGYVFDSFEELAAPKTLGKITERTVSLYAKALRETGASVATIHGNLAYLRAALRWAAKQKFIHEVPGFSMPKLPKKRFIRKIVAEQFEKMFSKASGPYWKAFVATAWYTGMRRNELLDLTWDDLEKPHIEFKTGKILLPAAYAKSVEDQWIPIQPELAAILQDMPGKAGQVFPFRSPSETSTSFRKLADSAGLKITLHDMRRSFGSRYAAVVPAHVFQELIRHSSIDTTLRFYTNLDDQLGAAILKA